MSRRGGEVLQPHTRRKLQRLPRPRATEERREMPPRKPSVSSGKRATLWMRISSPWTIMTNGSSILDDTWKTFYTLPVVPCPTINPSSPRFDRGPSWYRAPTVHPVFRLLSGIKLQPRHPSSSRYRKLNMSRDTVGYVRSLWPNCVILRLPIGAGHSTSRTVHHSRDRSHGRRNSVVEPLDPFGD